jgi:MoaA/NifB/PqqE/SkfB family radical SAM enzyme
MFFREEFCNKVFDAGLQEVTMSFHWHNGALHDYLVATPGAFRKSLKGLIYIKKYHPEIILNIDIVVNKMNVAYLPDIVKFFMKLWVYEFDILQIIPFWRGFSQYREKLFYNTGDYIKQLQDTWELSKIPWMYMWTNRFPAESFEWYEDLIQDPRKIKSEVMWEAYDMFEPFVKTDGEKKPECYGEACWVCFQNQYCHDFIKNNKKEILNLKEDNFILKWEEFPSQVFEKYGEEKKDFLAFLDKKKQEKKKLINVPKCLWWEGIYETYNDIKEKKTLEDYTYKYIKNLYRKKSLRCKTCKYDKKCEGIHINFIRSYWFEILEPIKN